MHNKAFIMVITILLSGNLFASQQGYFNKHAEGWHWYNDPILNQEEANDLNRDPVAEMNAVRATIERAKDKMVLHPTKKNVKEYIEIQNKVSGNAANLSKVWRDVLLENPELDYSLIHPTNNLAKQVENDLVSKQESDAIRVLSKRTGLFFFYRSSCPYCVKFAPIVKDFAETYGMTVIPITTDGISLPEFPNSYPDAGQAQKFAVKAEPALFIVNPYTHEAVPVSYGLSSESDLKSRMLDIAKKSEAIS